MYVCMHMLLPKFSFTLPIRIRKSLPCCRFALCDMNLFMCFVLPSLLLSKSHIRYDHTPGMSHTPGMNHAPGMNHTLGMNHTPGVKHTPGMKHTPAMMHHPV